MESENEDVCIEQIEKKAHHTISGNILLAIFYQKSAGSSLKGSLKSGPKELDEKIASHFHENGIAFKTAASASLLS